MNPPLPRVLVFVALSLPAVYFGAVFAARRMTADRGLRRALAPALALASWLLAVHALAITSRSFVFGLTAGTSAVAMLAAIPGPPAGRAPLRAWLPRLALIALATLPVAYVAFGWAFHDEAIVTGHMSISAEIQNGIYPPRHLTYASTELGYHYGFDLFTAILATIFRLSTSHAIDAASVTLFALFAWLLGALADLLFDGRRGRGAIAIVVVLFAGGLPKCLEPKVPRVNGLLGYCTVGKEAIVPSLLSNFFQHPWALGLPMAIAALLVFAARDRIRPTPRLAALALFLTTLSFAHVVLFATLLPSLVAAELFWAWRARRRAGDFLAPLAMAVVVALASRKLGGFFRAPSWGEANPFELRFGVVPGSSLRWHLQSFGLLLPVGLVGLFFLPKRARAAVVLVLAASFAVLETLHYRFTSDIVKFGCVAEVMMSLAAVALIDRALRLRPRIVRGAALVLAASLASGGSAFLLAFAAFPRQTTQLFKTSCPLLPPKDARVVAFLRARIRAGEVVYREEHTATLYSVWGGLPTPFVDWGAAGFGFPPSWLEARRFLLASKTATPNDYRAQGIVWFVLTPKDVAISTLVDKWITGRAAREVARFEDLRVVELTGR